MELYLVRHGQSANNLREQALAEHPGATVAPRMAEPPLTDLGELQARLAGESLREEGITTLYCGPMLRTLQTAQIVGAALNLSPTCSSDFTSGAACGNRATTAPAFSSPD